MTRSILSVRSLMFLLGLGLGAGIGPLDCGAVTFPLNWRWSNPTPHGNNIIDVAYSNQFWIQVAERGQVYTSGDMLTWTPRDSHTTRALRAVTFFNDQIVIVGENGTVVSGPSATQFSFDDLGTSDWLEGVAASDQVAVAVGDNGAVYSSADGKQWQRQNQPFADWLRSVAFGTPGGVGTFCAVGEAGFVATSTDGVKWTARARFTNNALNHVSWFSGEFWAVGDAGNAFQSSTGISWLNASCGANSVLNAFAGSDSMRLLAGESEARLRSGRSTWTDQIAGGVTFPAPDWTYLSAAADTNSFLLCGRTGMMVEGVPDASGRLDWVPISESLRNWMWDITRFPDLYLAVGDRATLLSSVDGIAWDVELPPDSATNSVFLGIGGRTNLAVVVGSGGTILTSLDSRQTVVSTNASGTVVTNDVSTLGIYWDAVSPRPTTNDLQGVAAFSDRLVVCGGTGTILTSLDGIAWSRQTSPTSEFLSSVAAFPQGAVAVGRAGVILSSPDAVSWTMRPSGTTNWIYRVRYTGGKLIAVGQNGTILTSSDGLTWNQQNSGSTHWLNNVVWIEDTYFAVGNQGTVLSSPDAVVWTDRGTITGKSLFGAATGGGMLVTVGVEGVILRSQVVPFDTPVNFLRFPRRPDESIFLFSGKAGQRFSLGRSFDLTNWTDSPPLEIDDTGTLLFLESLTNAAPIQFFRAAPKP
jgi:hypothetical protein